MKITPEPKKDKDTKLQTKSQSKVSTKKNRRSPLKKEKNGVSTGDVCPPESIESQVVAPCFEEAGSNEEPQLGSSCSPVHKLFQRTLSPADVLHVHSYAKGDYGEGETLEKKSEGSDNEVEKDNRHIGKAVSANRCYTHLKVPPHFIHQKVLLACFNCSVVIECNLHVDFIKNAEPKS